MSEPLTYPPLGSEAEKIRPALELYDIEIHPVNEAVNTLSWIKDHPGIKSFNFKNIHGQNRNFTYEVNNQIRFTSANTNHKLPEHIVPVFDEKLGRLVIAKSGFKGWWSEVVNESQEAHITGADAHPGIVAIHGLAANKEGSLYIIMEYLPNGSMEEWIQSTHTLKSIGRVVNKISDALHHVHTKRKVAFLDMKPLNIGFDSEWNPKLIDFGISQKLDQDGKAPNPLSITPLYAAPEQSDIEELTVQTDIYSFAATIFSIFTSATESTDTKNLREIFEDDAYATIPFREEYDRVLNDKQKSELTKVIRKALSKNPEERQKTVLEFNQEFQQALKK